MENQLSLKISKASVLVGKFAADKRNKEQGYEYISADQVLDRAGNALAVEGVTVYPNVTNIEVKIVERPSKSPRLDAQVNFEFIVTDGAFEQKCYWYGVGSDYTTPDKAVYKAITSGHKYFLMKLLNIGIGNEDSEHDNEPNGTRKLQPEQRKPSTAPTRQEQPKAEAKPAPSADHKLLVAEWSKSFNDIPLPMKGQAYPMKTPSQATDDELRKAIAHNKQLADPKYGSEMPDPRTGDGENK